MQRKTRELLYITLYFLISSHISFTCKRDLPDQYTSYESHGWRSTHNIFDPANAQTHEHAAPTPASIHRHDRPSLKRSNSNPKRVTERIEQSPTHQSVLIKKKALTPRVLEALRAQSPLSAVLTSDKDYATFYLESPRSHQPELLGKNNAVNIKAKFNKTKDGSPAQSKRRLTRAEVEVEAERLRREASADYKKTIEHKEKELESLAQELALLRMAQKRDEELRELNAFWVKLSTAVQAIAD